MQPSPERINTYENELFQSYTLLDKIKYLRRLYFFSAFELLITLISAGSSLSAYVQGRNLELLLLFITNLIIIGNSLLDIYWCQKYPAQLTDDRPEEDYAFQEIFQSSQQISYIHSLLSQISLASEIALFFCLIQFSTVVFHIWIAVLQVLIIIFLLYMVYVGFVYTHNIIGTKRFIIYISVILILLLSALSSIFLKQVSQLFFNKFQCMMEVHLQIYLINSSLIKCIKMILLLVVILTLLIAIANIRRMKPLFAALAFIFIVILIIQTIINGTFIRQIQEQQENLDTSAGCRFTMEIMGQKSLQQIGFFIFETNDQFQGCSQKYLNQEYSPFLPCDKSEQSYMWEQDVNKSPDEKLNTLACLNTGCCPSLSKNVLYYPKSFTILTTLIVAIGFVLAANLLALTKQQFKVFQIRVYGEIAVIILIAIILAALTLLAYNYEPTQPEQVQPQIVQSDEIEILRSPHYKRFQQQSPILVDYHLENCQLAQSMMLEHIEMNSGKTQNLAEPGLRVAISGTNGVFSTFNNMNSHNLWFLTSDEAIEKIFPNQKKSDTVKVDYIIFQGGVPEIDYFMNNGLFFCTDDPLNANFQIIQEYIDIKDLNHQISSNEDHQKRNLVTKQTKKSNSHFTQKEETVGTYQVNRFGNMQLDNLKFFHVKITIMDLIELTPVADANIYLYLGGYMLSSCQVITKLEPHMLYVKSNENGDVIFSNLDQGYLYTVLVQAENFKNGCTIVDLTQLSNQQLHYKIYVTPQLNPHSARLVLQWESDIDFDLYGVYNVRNDQCLTGPLSRSCGGMEHSQNIGIEYLTVNRIEPYEYLFFVTRSLNHQDVIQKISDKKKAQANQDIIQSKLKLVIYVQELDYPLLEYPMPICNQQYFIIIILKVKKDEYNQVEFVWLAFCMDGKKSDAPKALQSYWSNLSDEDILHNNGTAHPTWPSVSVCKKK